MRILTFIDWFLPGYKAGGIVKTLAGMVDSLPSDYEWLVVTRDRDLGDAQAYPGVRSNEWIPFRGARVLYLPRGTEGVRRLAAIARECAPDVVYLNGCFSRMSMRALLARRLGWMMPAPVVLAPRGEFSLGAMGLHSWRKYAYLATASRCGVLHHDIVWQGSSDREAADIRRVLAVATGNVAPRIRIAADLVPAEQVLTIADSARAAKSAGRARFVFISRISPMKNLHAAIQSLGALRGEIEFNIYGPIEDQMYWERCKSAMAALPPSVRAHYRGPLLPAVVNIAFRRHHFFVLPTLGENFGHVILEALASGCPVVLSDRTPWRGLGAAGCGWDLPLEPSQQWSRTLQRCVDMSGDEYARMVDAALTFARRRAEDGEAVRQTTAMFHEAASAVGVRARPTIDAGEGNGSEGRAEARPDARFGSGNRNLE